MRYLSRYVWALDQLCSRVMKAEKSARCACSYDSAIERGRIPLVHFMGDSPAPHAFLPPNDSQLESDISLLLSSIWTAREATLTDLHVMTSTTALRLLLTARPKRTNCQECRNIAYVIKSTTSAVLAGSTVKSFEHGRRLREALQRVLRY